MVHSHHIVTAQDLRELERQLEQARRAERALCLHRPHVFAAFNVAIALGTAVALGARAVSGTIL